MSQLICTLLCMCMYIIYSSISRCCKLIMFYLSSTLCFSFYETYCRLISVFSSSLLVVERLVLSSIPLLLLIYFPFYHLIFSTFYIIHNVFVTLCPMSSSISSLSSTFAFLTLIVLWKYLSGCVSNKLNPSGNCIFT